jgi:hypothetical protein
MFGRRTKTASAVALYLVVQLAALYAAASAWGTWLASAV